MQKHQRQQQLSPGAAPSRPRRRYLPRPPQLLDRVVVVVESVGHQDSSLGPVDEHTAPEPPLRLSRARSLRLSSHPPQIDMQSMSEPPSAPKSKRSLSVSASATALDTRSCSSATASAIVVVILAILY